MKKVKYINALPYFELINDNNWIYNFNRSIVLSQK